MFVEEIKVFIHSFKIKYWIAQFLQNNYVAPFLNAKQEGPSGVESRIACVVVLFACLADASPI